MKELNMPQFVNNLVSYLIGIKDLSEIYAHNMTITIKQFLEFINVHKLKNKYNSIEDFTLNDIRSLSNSDIYSFIYFLAESHYKTNSRVVKTEHLKTFFNYLFTIKETIFTQPFRKIKTDRKAEEKLPSYLSLDESKRLLNVYADSTKKTDIRNNAIIYLFLNCGLRLSEMSNLNIDDFNFSENKFIIFGKGKKERTGYLNKPTREALKKYLEYRNTLIDITKEDSNALFLSKQYGTYKRLSTSALKKLVNKAYLEAGIFNDSYSTHTLRHTCATLLYKYGNVNIRTIQELLRTFKNRYNCYIYSFAR